MVNELYPESFKKLVNKSVEKSKIHYGGHIPQYEEFIASEKYQNNANPFYIGFGNPNAKILILGKEKGFDYENNREQAWRESIANPIEWSKLVEERTIDHKHKSYLHNTNYYNAKYPYDGKMRPGHTWSKYQKMVDLILPENVQDFNNSFLMNSFISEVNHTPSKYSKKPYIEPHRVELLTEEFYRSFPITILACGNYLGKGEIEEIFDVQHQKDVSLSNPKLIVYSNKDRVLINTRQLSMNIKPELFENIKNEVVNYIN